MAVYALHKPRGLVTEQASPATRAYDGRRHSLNDWLSQLPAEGKRISAVGRLDKDTTGLLLLTSDGVLSERLLRPGAVTKVYEAVVKLKHPTRPTAEQLQRLVDGVELADGFAHASSVELVREWVLPPPEHLRTTGPRNAKKRQRAATGAGVEAVGTEAAAAGAGAAGETAPLARPESLQLAAFVVRITIAIGRNRVVRRLLAAVGLPVFELQRVQFGPLHLRHDLGLDEAGDLCRLDAAQVLQLRRAADCATAPDTVAEKAARPPPFSGPTPALLLRLDSGGRLVATEGDGMAGCREDNGAAAATGGEETGGGQNLTRSSPPSRLSLLTSSEPRRGPAPAQQLA